MDCAPDFLNRDQQLFLLGLARESLIAALGTGRKVAIRTEDPILLQSRGAFVTLKSKGDLRGCIGYPLPCLPLAEAVSELVVTAATQDTRFEPVEEAEIPDLEIEISVLTVPCPIEDPARVEVGKHGIIVTKGLRKGLLLPQVPGEYGWDRETYLKHGCLKAGLSGDAWKTGATIEVFEAQVFGED